MSCSCLSRLFVVLNPPIRKPGREAALHLHSSAYCSAKILAKSCVV